MGQPVAVVVKPTSQRGIVRLEANRNLTGMGHEVFRSSQEAVGGRPAASLARDLFATGHVTSVHMFGNMITVDLQKGCTAEGLSDVVRDMYQYWKPGMVPPAFDAPADEPAAADGGEAGAGAGAGAGPTAGGSSAVQAAYEQRIPAVLRERSAAARAKAVAAG